MHCLLIEPYGIEMIFRYVLVTILQLLIEPYGIEILIVPSLQKPVLTLLIEPYGIEISPPPA